MNELLKEELTGAYGGNMFGGGFCQVEFSEYNLLLYTNKDNHWEDLAGGSDRCAYLNHFQKEVNREYRASAQDGLQNLKRFMKLIILIYV